MIYMYRHGEKTKSSNCLSDMGIHRGELIGKIHLADECNVYTVAPAIPYKHVAPIQTASVACTVMHKTLHVLSHYTDVPRNHDSRTYVVVWHRGEIPAIMNYLRLDHDFEWPDDNYTGVVVVFDDGTWLFDPVFMYRPRYEQAAYRNPPP